MSSKGDGDAPRAGDEYLSLFRRGLQFTEELLADNERLRFRLAAIESATHSPASSGGGTGDPTHDQLRRRIEQLEAERERLTIKFQEVEELSRNYHTRYEEIESEHNNLANLYIASFQLHSTLSFREVTQVLSEIIINLVGVARFAVYLFDGEGNVLVPIAGDGVNLASLNPIKLGEGAIGRAAANRQRHIATTPQPGEPVAIIPLATLEGLVGAIVIDELLMQKTTLQPIDHELFNLLGAHAATALLSALLRDRAGPSGSFIDVKRAQALLT
jgi:GAF domain